MNHPVDNTPFVLTAAIVRTAAYTVASFALSFLAIYATSNDAKKALIAAAIACLSTLVPTGIAGGYDVSRAASGNVQIGDVGAFSSALRPPQG